MNKTIKDMNPDDRPYEKLEKYGVISLNNAELIAIILKTGIKNRNVVDVARDLLEFSNFDSSQQIMSLYKLTLEDFLKINGIGKVKAYQIMAALELSKRIQKEKKESKLKFDSSKTIAEYYMEEFRHFDVEKTYAIFLDVKLNYISKILIATGGINYSILPVREILKEGLRCNSKNIIILHNHPSGDPTPSKADIMATRNLNIASRYVELVLLDHIIIGDNDYISLKEEGMIME